MVRDAKVQPCLEDAKLRQSHTYWSPGDEALLLPYRRTQHLSFCVNRDCMQRKTYVRRFHTDSRLDHVNPEIESISVLPYSQISNPL
jgi:hypothetical protein